MLSKKGNVAYTEALNCTSVVDMNSGGFLLKSSASEKTVSKVQYGTVRYSMVQYGTLRYSMVQYCTVWYSKVQYGTVRYSMVQ